MTATFEALIPEMRPVFKAIAVRCGQRSQSWTGSVTGHDRSRQEAGCGAQCMQGLKQA